MKRPRSRKVFIIGVLLLLLGGGAIVNVAVAWGCSTLKYEPVESVIGYTHEIGPCWLISIDSSITGKRVYLRPLWSDSDRAALRATLQLKSAPAWSAGVSAPSMAQRAPVLGEGDFAWVEQAFGFPTQGLLWRHHLKLFGPLARHTKGRFIGGIEMDAGAPDFRERARALPLIPIWPGFAINTIFYTAILWVVLFVPGILKRTLRRRRGLCPACAYPVGTSNVCTECGAAVSCNERCRNTDEGGVIP